VQREAEPERRVGIELEAPRRTQPIGVAALPDAADHDFSVLVPHKRDTQGAGLRYGKAPHSHTSLIVGAPPSFVWRLWIVIPHYAVMIPPWQGVVFDIIWRSPLLSHHQRCPLLTVLAVQDLRDGVGCRFPDALAVDGLEPHLIPHHETFSTTIQPSYSSTKG
jgi:hypothetical protein